MIFPLIFQVRMGAWNVLKFIEIILFSKSWILKHSSSKDFNVFVEWICVSVNSFSPLQKPQLNEKLRCFDCRVQQQLQQVFRDFNATCIDLRIGDNCLKMTGYIAIYKISFSITIFFVTMFFITLGVTTSKGIRACIHNGFWLIKVREEEIISLIPI